MRTFPFLTVYCTGAGDPSECIEAAKKPGRRGSLEPVERAHGGGDHLWRNRRVARRRLHAAVAEQYLDDAQFGAVLEQVRCKTVAKRVRTNVFQARANRHARND